VAILHKQAGQRGQVIENAKIAVVIPAFKVSTSILEVVSSIGKEVDEIWVVDDNCPENSGFVVSSHSKDKRVRVIRHEHNQGVGGAVISGYREAFLNGADVVVKVDGDGQMDTTLIPNLVFPILRGEADYVKGNRFESIESVRDMPMIRLVGNAGLTFLTKISSGYWNISDPTNGFTAISSTIAKSINFDKIAKRYFFESDMLFRLNVSKAVVLDLPIPARYGSEKSNLSVIKSFLTFPALHLRNFIKRVFYSYYLREMSIASFELPMGFLLFTFGLVFGITNWLISKDTGIPASTGTVMLAVLPIILGIQLLLAFTAFDVNSTPNRVRTPSLSSRK
jgi:glycosyltransferase involved in cell wall biosynthesis